MQYKNAILDLQAGDVVLYHTCLSYKPVSWLAGAIRLFTRSMWNHAAVVLQIDYDLYLAEALGGGVRLRPTAQFLARPKSRIKVLRHQDADAMCSYVHHEALKKLGTKYDTKAILDHLWKALNGGRWTGYTEAHAEGAMVCSEYVAYCFCLKEWWLWTAADLDNSTTFKTVYNEYERPSF